MLSHKRSDKDGHEPIITHDSQSSDRQTKKIRRSARRYERAGDHVNSMLIAGTNNSERFCIN